MTLTQPNFVKPTATLFAKVRELGQTIRHATNSLSAYRIAERFG